MGWLSEVFQKGGPFFIVNTFFLAVVIGLIVERAIYFLGRGHLNAKAFLEQIKRLLAANNIDRAKKLCDATTAPVARVAKAGLNRIHRGEAAVAQAMDETMTDALPGTRPTSTSRHRADRLTSSPCSPPIRSATSSAPRSGGARTTSRRRRSPAVRSTSSRTSTSSPT